MVYSGSHKLSSHKLYAVWAVMHQRCTNKQNKNYAYYGGKGVKVCSEWRTFMPFYNWATNNGYAVGLSLERKDNKKNYEPDNCTWITQKEQMRNTTRNKILTIFNETKLQEDWINDPRCLTSHGTFRRRLTNGWSLEKALTTPSNKVGKGSRYYGT